MSLSGIRFLRKGLIAFIAAGLCAPALGQALPGDYQMIGRRCEDSKKLAPPDDSTQMIFFESNGSFRHTFFVINAPFAGDGETLEEHQERRRERKTARFLGYFEEDRARHEKACREQGAGVIDDGLGNDACVSRHKERLYEKWRSERMAELEEELDRDEEEDRRFIEDNTFECFMELNGSYTAQGSRLSIFPGAFSATEGCGADSSYPDRLDMSYYIEGATLYLVNRANEISREYCGSSDWAEIYVRQ